MVCQHKLNWVQGFQNWSMCHPNITKMRQSQVSYVSKQTLGAVNLWCVDWKNLRQQFDNAIKTQPGNALDDRRLNSIRRNLSQNVSTDRHFVLTELHLLLKSIRILPGRSLNNQSIVIAGLSWVSWQDCRDSGGSTIPQIFVSSVIVRRRWERFAHSNWRRTFGACFQNARVHERGTGWYVFADWEYNVMTTAWIRIQTVILVILWLGIQCHDNSLNS